MCAYVMTCFACHDLSGYALYVRIAPMSDLTSAERMTRESAERQGTDWNPGTSNYRAPPRRHYREESKVKLRNKARVAETATDVAITLVFPPYAVVAVASAYMNVKGARKAARKDGGK